MSAPAALPPAWTARTLVVEPRFDGWRLDRFVRAHLPHVSRVRVQEMIRGGLVGGLKGAPKPASRVRSGLRLEVWRPARDESAPPDEVGVVHADDDLLVVDKPALLAVHPDGRHRHATLTALLGRRFETRRGKPVPAHRIDRETSGLVVFGRHPEASRRLKVAFARRQVAKEYLAVVEGHPPWDAARIDLPLRMGGERIRIQMVVAADGLPAVTDVAVLRRFRAADGAPLALVGLSPLTGRQHQIRAHLSAWGFPVVGDKIYGPDERIFLEQVEGNGVLSAASLARLRLPRQALHACALELRHPFTGEPMRFEAPLPCDLAALLGDQAVVTQEAPGPRARRSPAARSASRRPCPKGSQARASRRGTITAARTAARTRRSTASS